MTTTKFVRERGMIHQEICSESLRQGFNLDVFSARSGNDLLGMDTPPEKPVVSRRTLLAQAQNAETGESTNTSTVAPVDLFELSPSQNVSDAVQL